MDKIDFYLGVISIVMSMQWHAHYMKGKVSFLADILTTLAIGVLIGIRIFN